MRPKVQAGALHANVGSGWQTLVAGVVLIVVGLVVGDLWLGA